jgi:hypothetical protein
VCPRAGAVDLQEQSLYRYGSTQRRDRCSGDEGQVGWDVIWKGRRASRREPPTRTEAVMKVYRLAQARAWSRGQIYCIALLCIAWTSGLQLKPRKSLLRQRVSCLICADSWHVHATKKVCQCTIAQLRVRLYLSRTDSSIRSPFLVVCGVKRRLKESMQTFSGSMSSLLSRNVSKQLIHDATVAERSVEAEL